MSKKILIVTDSSNTISEANATKYDIKVIPFYIIRNDSQMFVDDNAEITMDSMLEQIDKGFSFTTSTIPPEVLKDFFTQEFKTYDQIIMLPISNGMSSQHTHAKGLEKEFPDKLFVFDTREIGVMIESLSIHLRNEISKGNDDITKLKEIAENYHKYCTTFITCKVLDGFLKSGRAPKTIVKLIKIAKVSPIMRTEYSNHAAGVAKNYGSSIDKIIRNIQDVFGNLKTEDIQEAFIYSTGLSEEEINWIAGTMNKQLHIPIEKIEIRDTPLTVSCHTWKGSYGVAIRSQKQKAKISSN